MVSAKRPNVQPLRANGGRWGQPDGESMGLSKCLPGGCLRLLGLGTMSYNHFALAASLTATSHDHGSARPEMDGCHGANLSTRRVLCLIAVQSCLAPSPCYKTCWSFV